MKRNLTIQFVVLGFAAATFVAALPFADHRIEVEPVWLVSGPTVQHAYDRLLSAGAFSIGRVGFAGRISGWQEAFEVLADSTNALELFTAVLEHGNPQAQLYALCGIHRLAPEKFKVLARPLVVANPQVRTMSGCIGGIDCASNVVARIADGGYDLNKFQLEFS